MDCKDIRFSRHAIEKMFERALGSEHIRETLANGDVIADFPDDKPFPSCLMLHFVGGRPIHVVAALDPVGQRCIIITACRPDPELWESDFRTRRPR